MSERDTDKKRIDNAQDGLLRQRLAALAAITKLEVGLDLLRQLVNEAPFGGMTTFENDSLTCMDELRVTTQEIWTRVNRMISTIHAEAGLSYE